MQNVDNHKQSSFTNNQTTLTKNEELLCNFNNNSNNNSENLENPEKSNKMNLIQQIPTYLPKSPINNLNPFSSIMDNNTDSIYKFNLKHNTNNIINDYNAFNEDSPNFLDFNDTDSVKVSGSNYSFFQNRNSCYGNLEAKETKSISNISGIPTNYNSNSNLMSSYSTVGLSESHSGENYSITNSKELNNISLTKKVRKYKSRKEENNTDDDILKHLRKKRSSKLDNDIISKKMDDSQQSIIM